MRLLTLLTFLLASTVLAAQTSTTGSLAGVVVDPTGALVPAAHLILKDNAKGTIQEADCDAEGSYLVPFLAPANYTVAVSHPGFRTESYAVAVSLGPPTTLNARLDVAPAQFSVLVTDKAPWLRAENGDYATTLKGAQISQVPNPGNDLTYIPQTSPGALMNTEGGNGPFSIQGMPGFSNVFTLNGMTENEMGFNSAESGALNLVLGQNQIQEATIVSNGYSGEFGRLAGSNISFITKSGGNTFHGNAEYYWNGSILNSNEYFNKQFGNSRPFDNANQWAASLGGPIKKQKVFFFADTEGMTLIVPMPQFVVIPSPQFEAATLANIAGRFGTGSASDAFYKQIFGLYDNAIGVRNAVPGDLNGALGCMGFVGPDGLGVDVPCERHYFTNLARPSDESLVSGRLDWDIRNSDRMFFLLQYDHGYQAGYTDPINPIFNMHSVQLWWQGQLSETHTFGSSSANQFLLAGWSFDAPFKVTDEALARNTFPTQLAWNGFFTGLGLSSFGGEVSLTQYRVSDDFLKTWARHSFRAGMTLDRAIEHNSANVVQANGVLVPQTLDAFFQGGLDPATPDTDFTQLSQRFHSPLRPNISFYQLGVYAQDDWRVRPNLVLTLSLRAEHQSVPVCQNRCFARAVGTFESANHAPDQPYNTFLSTNQAKPYGGLDSILWMPRLGFAWQPYGVNHNTVVRGGVGFFCDQIPPQHLISSASNNPPLNDSFVLAGNNLAPDEVSSLFKDTAASEKAFQAAFASGETFEQIQSSVSGFSPPGLNVQDKRLHAPQYQKWNIEIQHTFGANSFLSVGYSGNHGLHEVILNPSLNAYGLAAFPPSLCSSPAVAPCADPKFGEVIKRSSVGVSNYNGLIVSFRHRSTGRASGVFQANYTYGHALDISSNGGIAPFTGGDSRFPQDPNNIRGSYGNAEYDVRHSFNASYVWELPLKAMTRGRGADVFLKGWQVSGTVFAHSGFPYTVFDSTTIGELNAQNFFGSLYAVPFDRLPLRGTVRGLRPISVRLFLAFHPSCSGMV